MDYMIKDTYHRIVGEIGYQGEIPNERTIHWLGYYKDKGVPLWCQEGVIRRCIPVSKFDIDDINEIFANEQNFLAMAREVYKNHRKVFNIQKAESKAP